MSDYDKLLIDLHAKVFAPWDSSVPEPVAGSLVEVGFVDMQGTRVAVYYGPIKEGSVLLPPEPPPTNEDLAGGGQRRVAAAYSADLDDSTHGRNT